MRRLLLFIAAMVPSDVLASGCTITGNAPTVTATAMDFHTYNAGSLSADQANATVQIKCPLGIGLLPSFTIALPAGTAKCRRRNTSPPAAIAIPSR